ncbi:AAA family ATPase [Pseudothauera nasutitermitis]|uniref:AAA family ATPase n=1 Tax=Pseudothauera nasutitermitis TaxID=2565930 RepID=UPI001454BE8E|nr:AAA family ATPase [Pseudothauera nasutitermitis]
MSPALAALREGVRAFRLRMRVAREAEAEACTYGRERMVRVFDPTRQPGKTLSGERDIRRRQEEILALLKQRGPLRLIGAESGLALAERLSVLYDSHPNFSAATDYVLQEEILARHRGEGLCGLRLLIHGGAGLGKTDYCLRLAELLGLPVRVMGMSSAQASAGLGGSETYWGNTQPGHVWSDLIQGDYANPVFVLDEIEKSDKRAGDPLGALYQLLEERTARAFEDKSVPWLPVDTRYVIWLATANDVSGLHPAMLSRFTLIEAREATRGQREQLAQTLYQAVLDEHGLRGKLPEALDRRALERLLNGSVRDMKRVLRSAVACALRSGDGRIQVPLAQDTGPRCIGFIQ